MSVKNSISVEPKGPGNFTSAISILAFMLLFLLGHTKELRTRMKNRNKHWNGKSKVETFACLLFSFIFKELHVCVYGTFAFKWQKLEHSQKRSSGVK
jgi:hypothetical protein